MHGKAKTKRDASAESRWLLRWKTANEFKIHVNGYERDSSKTIISNGKKVSVSAVKHLPRSTCTGRTSCVAE